MSIYVWTSKIKNVYIWTTPVKEVYVWTTKVRPTILEYDFTTSDWWWETSNSDVVRWSKWFYINNSSTFIDRYISAPNNLFSLWVPKKIILVYSKSMTSTWTGIWYSGWTYEYDVPRDRNNLNYLAIVVKWTPTNYSLGANPTWTVTWELDIDSSTTNWTVTHKITWCSTVTETSWVLKYIFTNNALKIRLVHWTDTSWLYIQSIRFEY